MPLNTGHSEYFLAKVAKGKTGIPASSARTSCISVNHTASRNKEISTMAREIFSSPLTEKALTRNILDVIQTKSRNTKLQKSWKGYNDVAMIIKRVSALEMANGMFIKPSRLWGHVRDSRYEYVRIYALKPFDIILRKWYRIKESGLFLKFFGRNTIGKS